MPFVGRGRADDHRTTVIAPRPRSSAAAGYAAAGTPALPSIVKLRETAARNVHLFRVGLKERLKLPGSVRDDARFFLVGTVRRRSRRRTNLLPTECLINEYVASEAVQ